MFFQEAVNQADLGSRSCRSGEYTKASSPRPGAFPIALQKTKDPRGSHLTTWTGKTGCHLSRDDGTCFLYGVHYYKADDPVRLTGKEPESTARRNTKFAWLVMRKYCYVGYHGTRERVQGELNLMMLGLRLMMSLASPVNYPSSED